MKKRRAPKLNFKSIKKIGIPVFRAILKCLPLAILTFSVFFVFVGVRQMLHADPYFQVEKITVIPGGILTRSELQFLESKSRGMSLMDINLRDVSTTLEKNPKVLRAEVVRVLPKQLSIYLTPRLPYIQIQTVPSGPCYLVSRDQLILEKMKSATPHVLLVEDFNSVKKNYSVGTFYQNNNYNFLLDLVETLRNTSPFKQETISKIVIDQIGNCSVLLKDGLELKVGKKFKLTDGAQLVLSSLLKSKDRKDILYLDLRYRDIIVKKKSD